MLVIFWHKVQNLLWNPFTAASVLGTGQKLSRVFVATPFKASSWVLVTLKASSNAVKSGSLLKSCRTDVYTSDCIAQTRISDPSHNPHAHDAAPGATLLDLLHSFQSIQAEQSSQALRTCIICRQPLRAGIICLVVRSHYSAPVEASFCTLNLKAAFDKLPLLLAIKEGSHFTRQAGWLNGTRVVLFNYIIRSNLAYAKPIRPKWQAITNIDVWESFLTRRSSW